MYNTYKKLGGGDADESLSLFRSLLRSRSRSLSRSLRSLLLLRSPPRFVDDGLGVRRDIGVFGLFVFFGDLEKRLDCFRLLCLRGSCGGDFERDLERLLLRLFDLQIE